MTNIYKGRYAKELEEKKKYRRLLLATGVLLVVCIVIALTVTFPK